MPDAAVQRHTPDAPHRAEVDVDGRYQRHNVDSEGRAVPPSDVERSRGSPRAQDGVVTPAQLLRARAHAPTRSARASQSGRLTPVYRGVYAVGPACRTAGGSGRRLLADGPVLRPRATHGRRALRDSSPPCPPFSHVSLTRGDRRSRPGLHDPPRTRTRATSRTSHGIPVTTPLRTLEDLGWPRPDSSAEALARSLVPRPSELAERRDAPDATTSFEDRMRALIRRAGLPQPVVAVPLGPYRARLRLARPAASSVETDGWATHGRRAGLRGRPRPRRGPPGRRLARAARHVPPAHAASRRSSPRSSRRCSLRRPRPAPRTAPCTAARSPRPPAA